MFNKKDHEDVYHKATKAQKNISFLQQERRNRNHNKADIINEKIVEETCKLRPRYKKQEVKEDLGNKVLVKSRKSIA